MIKYYDRSDCRARAYRRYVNEEGLEKERRTRAMDKTKGVERRVEMGGILGDAATNNNKDDKDDKEEEEDDDDGDGKTKMNKKNKTRR